MIRRRRLNHVVDRGRPLAPEVLRPRYWRRQFEYTCLLVRRVGLPAGFRAHPERHELLRRPEPVTRKAHDIGLIPVLSPTFVVVLPGFHAVCRPFFLGPPGYVL